MGKYININTKCTWAAKNHFHWKERKLSCTNVITQQIKSSYRYGDDEEDGFPSSQTTTYIGNIFFMRNKPHKSI